MRLMPLLTLACALSISVQAASAQTKIPVSVAVTANDSVGRQLAFHLRDQIGRSGTFSLSDEAVLKVVLVTLDPDKQDNRTIYNYTFVLSGMSSGLDAYLTGGVGICGKSRVQECGLDVMTSLGEEVEVIRQALSSSKKADFH